MRNRTCYLCGRDYQYCPSCTEDRYRPAFMSAYCSQDCADIFDICTRYNMGVVTKEDAKEALLTKDLSRRENFKDCVKNDLNHILTVNPEEIVIEEPKVDAPKSEEKIPEKKSFKNFMNYNTREVVKKKK